MDPFQEADLITTRRHFFSRSATGIGTAALASLTNPDLFAAPAPAAAAPIRNGIGGLADLPHFAPKAKRVIYLFMSGAPSQTRSVRSQAKTKRHGSTRTLPDSVRQWPAFYDHDIGAGSVSDRALHVPFFRQHGSKAVREMSELLPHMAKIGCR